MEPALSVESRDVNDESVALPSSIQYSHPRVDGRFFGSAHVDDAIRGRVFVRKHDVLLRLDNLQRIRHVRRARQIGHIAFDFWIQLQPVRKIFVSALSRLPVCRELRRPQQCFDPMELRRSRRVGKGPGLRGMIFNLPVRRRYRLP
jgi:hypothetical protein